MISRATVYNTLNLFVERGCFGSCISLLDSVLFDANTDRHHHFHDESGRIYDVPGIRSKEERETAAGVRGSRVSSGDARSSSSTLDAEFCRS